MNNPNYKKNSESTLNKGDKQWKGSREHENPLGIHQRCDPIMDRGEIHSRHAGSNTIDLLKDYFFNSRSRDFLDLLISYLKNLQEQIS